MGVEYEHVAFVGGRYRPSAERIARFVRALADEGWIASPKTFREKKVSPSRLPKAVRRTGAMLHVLGPSWEPAPFAPTVDWLRSQKRYLRLSWPMVDVLELGGRFPVEPLPFVREGLSYELEIRWARYYSDIVSDDLPEFSGRCVCGTDLGVPGAHFLGPRLFRTACPQCGEDPASFQSGQLLHRFALVVDCNKNLPEEGSTPTLHPALRALRNRFFSRKFTQVGVIC